MIVKVVYPHFNL